MVSDRRIVRVNLMAGTGYVLEWNPNWFNTRIFRGTATTTEAAVQGILDDLGRQTE